MKVENMKTAQGNKVKNQVIIYDAILDAEVNTIAGKMRDTIKGTMFQSYDSNIAFKSYDGQILLDKIYWDYSVTTSKYRNLFLNESKKETEKKIENGTYILTDLS